MRGAFGMIDEKNKTITINKKRHKNKQALKKIPKKDRPLGNTIMHEETHAEHPRMREKTVRKVARKKFARMSKKQKSKMYSRYG